MFRKVTILVHCLGCRNQSDQGSFLARVLGAYRAMHVPGVYMVSEHPVKILKHLLVFAVARLLELGDTEAVEEIMRWLPPVERGERG